jgi:hypothetical protein
MVVGGLYALFGAVGYLALGSAVEAVVRACRTLLGTSRVRAACSRCRSR